ncbi:TPA: hypothetical protein RQN04_002028 [Aeromonas hydrophila]|nr:hypothetical protein [Aeromonas hydrophila]
MNTNDKPRFLLAHKALTVAYPDRAGDMDFTSLCEAALSAFPIEVVESVYHTACTTSMFGAWCPKPGQLAGLAGELMASVGEKTPEAWAHEWFAWILAKLPDLRKPPEGSTVMRNELMAKCDHQAIQAVKDVGGLGLLGRTEDSKARKAFVAAYVKLEPRYQDAPPRVPKPEGDHGSPIRGRELRQSAMVALQAADSAQAQLGYQGQPRDIAGLLAGRMKP